MTKNLRIGSAIRVFLVGSLVVSYSGPVGAEASDAFAFFQEEAQVVAASQHAQKLSEAPASAYVITAEEIDRYGYQTLAEALQSVPGILASTDRNYTYVSFRGFGRPSDYNDRILVMIDGHRINDDLYGAAYIGEEFITDLKAVDHIEIIKGAASALYGSNAFFGVINVVTKSAGYTPLATASAEFGSYGMHREFAAVAPEFSNGLKAYLSGSYRNANGQNLFYSQYSNINGGVAAGSDAESRGGFFGKLSYAGFTLTGDHGSRTKHVPTGSFGTVFNDPTTQTKDTWSFMDLQGEHSLRPDLVLNTRVYYNWVDYWGDYVFANTPPDTDTLLNLDSNSTRSVGQEIRLRATPWGAQNALTIGQEYDKMTRGAQVNHYDGFPPEINVNTKTYRWAAFIQQEWKPYSALALTLGGRYDYYETFGKTLNPRLAAIHDLWQDSVVKILYGTAFRAPSAYEMFYGSALTFTPNPTLAPEKITSYEMVLEQQFPGAGMVSLSGYENRVTGLIDQTTLPDDRIQFQNLSDIRSVGLELYAKWAWNKSLSGFAGYNLQNTREVHGAFLSNSPVHSGSAGVSALIEPTGTTLSLQGLFIGKRQTNQQTTLPKSAIFSLTARERPWKMEITLYASVYNLLDTAYSTSGAGEHVQDAIPQDGRHFTLGAEYKFR